MYSRSIRGPPGATALVVTGEGRGASSRAREEAASTVNVYPYDAGAAEFDVIIIGAGINGSAIARDCAMRGLRTVVVDKGDIGAGTTSKSTRLIHGGLRYLEHFEVPLVREALHERGTLLRNAPHLVQVLHFLLPVYAEGSHRESVIRLGMLAYEVLSLGDHGPGHHQMLSPEETLRVAPGLAPEGLRGGALYQDAQAVYPERLALENALSAREHGALVLTYARANGFDISADRVTAVHLTDGQTGRRQRLKGAVVINAAGPWADDVLAGLPGDRPRLIGGTKGSHLIVEPFPGAPRTALYTEAVDNRPYFIVPWAGSYLIGTTDERFDGDLDGVAATAAEIDYLIESTNQVIPAAGLSRQQVLWTYSGVRPLPYEPGIPEAKVTRKHVLHVDEQVRNLITIVGGKLTTHRSLAERAVDVAFDILGRRSPACTTADQPLPGGRAADWDRFADGFRQMSGLPADIADHLLDVYGTRAADVLGYAGEDERLRTRLPGTSALAAEVPFAFRAEQASTIADLCLRRTMIGVHGDLGLNALGAVNELVRTELGWDPREAEAQASEYWHAARCITAVTA